MNFEYGIITNSAKSPATPIQRVITKTIVITIAFAPKAFVGKSHARTKWIQIVWWSIYFLRPVSFSTFRPFVQQSSQIVLSKLPSTTAALYCSIVAFSSLVFSPTSSASSSIRTKPLCSQLANWTQHERSYYLGFPLAGFICDLFATYNLHTTNIALFAKSARQIALIQKYLFGI